MTRSGGGVRGCAAGVALAVLGSVTSGCAVWTTVGGPAVGFTPFVERVVEGTALRDFKGVIHCHSFLSHDSDGAVADIARACERTGLDFLVMTDHQTPQSIADGARGLIGNTLFVTGAEIRTRAGTLLAFPLTRYVGYSPIAPRMLATIHEQGGLAFVGHAERFRDWEIEGLDGVETINLHAAALDASKLSLLMSGLFGSMRQVLATIAKRPDGVLERYDARVAHSGVVPMISGNDAHENVSLFGPLGGTIGTYDELFHTVTTHVLATELTEAALVEGFQSARTYVVFDLFRDGTGFDFRLFGRARSHVIGSVVEREAGQEFVVRTPFAATIRLLRDGVVVAERGTTDDGVRELRWSDPEPGDYRVEAYLRGGRPWIFSSPIRVRG